MGGEAPLPQGLGIDIRDLDVSVDHKDLPGFGVKVVDPAQQAVPVGMGGEAVEVDDPGPDGDLLTEELDRFDAVQQAAAQRALALVAHKDHGGLLPPQVVLEVVADAARVAHAGGRDDDLGHLVHVQGLGLFAGLGDVEAGELEKGAALQSLNGLLVQIAVEIAGENFGGLACQGRVHIHREAGDRLHHALLLHLTDEIQQFLGAAHRKGGDDHIAAPAQGVINDGGQLFGVLRILLHIVVPVAVGALGEDVVGLGDVAGVPDDGLVPVADVAGKDDLACFAALGKPHFHTGRAQQMACVGKADADAGFDLKLVAVFAGHHMGEGGLGVGHGVQRLHRLPAGALALLVEPLGVALLDVGRVPQHDGQQLPRQAGAVDIAGKALFDQQRDAPRVVDVGVGDHHGVDVAGVEVQLPVVPLIPTLLEAAVDQDLFPIAFHTVTASGHGSGRAKKGELHSGPPCMVCTIIVLHLERTVNYRCGRPPAGGAPGRGRWGRRSAAPGRPTGPHSRRREGSGRSPAP